MRRSLILPLGLWLALGAAMIALSQPVGPRLPLWLNEAMPLVWWLYLIGLFTITMVRDTAARVTNRIAVRIAALAAIPVLILTILFAGLRDPADESVFGLLIGVVLYVLGDVGLLIWQSIRADKVGSSKRGA